MKLTIIPIDSTVYVDGFSYGGLDLSSAPTNVHALQWKDTTGWIEFVDNNDGTKPQNQIIDTLPDWANVAKAKWDAANELSQQPIQAAADQPPTIGTMLA